MKIVQATNLSQFARIAASLLLALLLLTGCGIAAPAAEDSVSVQTATASTTAKPSPAATLPPVSLAEVLPGQDTFSILFVNVGKADAAILRFGDVTVLIDTGSAESAPKLIAGLNAMNVSSIDGVFITHSHSDHLGGLDALAANYHIPVVYSPFFSEQDKNGAGKVVKRAEKLGLTHRELQAGESIPITSDVSFSVLGPLSLNEENDNDNSLVLRFSCGGKTFLFTGDMQFSEEQEIIDAGADLKSDVLKVGNHGNPDATGDDFASLVSPALAVISTSTLEDPDSANARVFAALPTADVFVTQDFAIGALLTLDDTGRLVISNPARNEAAKSVAIRRIDAEAQIVTLENDGTSDVDLSGCMLYSERSGAVLRFPDGTRLVAGQTLTIGSGGDFVFPGDDKPLSRKKANTVILYHKLGTVISEIAE